MSVTVIVLAAVIVGVLGGLWGWRRWKKIQQRRDEQDEYDGRESRSSARSHGHGLSCSHREGDPSTGLRASEYTRQLWDNSPITYTPPPPPSGTPNAYKQHW